MSKIQKFEDLEVWKDSAALFEDIYIVASKEKIKKEYGLRDQLVRAAISISNNIAEGFEYDNTKDFIKFLRYSKGSTGEVRNLLNLLLRIKLIDTEQHSELTTKAVSISKQLFGFINYLKNRNKVN